MAHQSNQACATKCLQEPDVKRMARCIALDMDCAAICRLASGYMAPGSEFAKRPRASAAPTSAGAWPPYRHRGSRHCLPRGEDNNEP
jgi:hypothetical protein